MNILSISGIIAILIGIFTAVFGIIQGKKRIESEDNYISADAEILRMDSRFSVTLLNWIPIIAKEYRPVIRYKTEGGKEIESDSMPFSMKMSDECHELFRMYETKTPITIHYDPEAPSNFYYKKRTGFRIREVIYKFIIASVLIALGAFILWGSTLS
ncbi:MAG TPA: DUF3592 domain-containing protein [Ruminococcus sp.]